MAKSKKLKMELDFDGLLQILAKNLYNKKDVFIREITQNSHDACWRRHHRDDAFDIGQAAIDILPDLTADPGRIVFRDNGEGMTNDDLVEFLSTIGRSGTKEAREDAPEVIGQFGIGFLSGFVIGCRVEVRTRHFTAEPEEALLWVSEGEQEYAISQTRMDRAGTEVTITLKDASEKGFISEEAVKKAVVTYADMLRVPIYINDPHHVGGGANSRLMPWEKEMSDSERKFEYMLFLEKRVPDSVLEVIPVNLEDTHGLLYITKNRILATHIPRTMRLYIRRMHLDDNATELLPPWAAFVNGLINSDTLEPNAARDNYMRNEKAADLQKRLGDCIIQHLEKLRDENPVRLSQILRYQDFAIKAACHYHDELYEKFWPFLDWRVNPGAKLETADAASEAPSWEDDDLLIDDGKAHYITLPRLLDGLPAPAGGGAKRLSYFSSRLARMQFFQIADATGTVVLDASAPFEEQLLRTWAKWHEDDVSLVRSGQIDDPAMFGGLQMPGDEAVRRLAEHMSRFITPGGRGHIEVDAKRIKPDDLASLLRDEEQSVALQKAYNMLNDANTSGELKRMAEEMIRMSRKDDMRMLINAANPLVRGVADLFAHAVSINNQEMGKVAEDLMLGLYNSAVLSNQRMLSSSSAQIFYSQFQTMMQRIIEQASTSEKMGVELRMVSEKLASQQTEQATEHSKQDYLQGFYVTPFGDGFDTVRAAMRKLIEQHFRCKLVDANDETLDERIGENVKKHIREADFFVVDITGPKPGVMNANVMMELGAISMARPDAPCLPIAAVEKKGQKFELPADIGELICYPYVLGDTPEELQETWKQDFEKKRTFMDLLEQRPEEFVSTETILAALTNPKLEGARLEYDKIAALCKKLPTLSEWQNVDESLLIKILGGGPIWTAAAPLLKAAVIFEAKRH